MQASNLAYQNDKTQRIQQRVALERLIYEGRQLWFLSSDDPPSTADIIWELLVEATETAKTISKPGPKSPGSAMPEYWHTNAEIYGVEIQMAMDNISYPPDDRRPQTSAAAKRFLATMDLLKLLKSQRAPKTRKMLFFCAGGMGYDRIAHVLGYPSRQAVAQSKKRALNRLAELVDMRLRDKH